MLSIRPHLLLPALIALAAAHGSAQAPRQLSAMNSVQSGQWEFRAGRAAAPSRLLCIANPQAFFQLQHYGRNCAQFVVANDPRTATVHYTCANGGYGQTTVRVETPRLVQLDSQGVANNAPFAFSTEGRRVGECPGSAR